MSSAVNKSSTRFAPKTPAHRGAGRQKPRQLSVSSSARPVLTNIPAAAVEAVTGDKRSRVSEAIEETVSELDQATLAAQAAQRSGRSRTESHPRRPSIGTAATHSTQPRKSEAPAQDASTKVNMPKPPIVRQSPVASTPRLASLSRPTQFRPGAFKLPQKVKRPAKVVSMSTPDSFISEPASATKENEKEPESEPGISPDTQADHQTESPSAEGEPAEATRNETPPTKESQPVLESGDPKDAPQVASSVSQVESNSRSTRSSARTRAASRRQERATEIQAARERVAEIEPRSELLGRGRGLSPEPDHGPISNFYSSSIVTDTMTPLEREAEPTTSLRRSSRFHAHGFTAKNSPQVPKESSAVAPVVVPKPTPPVIPPKVYTVDEKGRSILDPEDLPKVGRGHRKVEVQHPEKKAINIDTFTMADLCTELPIGEKNDDYEAFENNRRLRKRNREELLRLKKLARIEGRVLTDEERAPFLSNEDLAQEKRMKFDAVYRANDRKSAQLTAPELLSDQGGNWRVDQDTLLVDRHVVVDETERTVVYEDDREIRMNSGTYSRREKPDRWDNEETSEFYKALSHWGTDFNLIAQLFPGRNRRQIKAKYKIEERKNPAKVHLAVLRKLPVDLETFSRASGTEVRDVDSIELEIKAAGEKELYDIQQEEEKKKRTKQADLEAAARADAKKYGGSSAVKKKEEGHNDVDGPSEEIVGTIG